MAANSNSTSPIRTGVERWHRATTIVQTGTGTASLLLLAGALKGCAVVRPRSISSGRGAYAEAIDRTQDEQIPLLIVKGRYGESAMLLAVNNVIANLRFRVEADTEAGSRGVGNLSVGHLL